LAGHNVKKVLWVSFGDVTESWFVACQVKDGTIALRLGTDAPAALRKYINQISSSKVLLGSLRAQLGPNGSFVAWSNTAWACYNVPAPLRARLCQLSSSTREDNGITMGSVLKGPLLNVQWHADGSFYIRRMDIHVAIFNSTVMREAWRNLWPGVALHEMQPEHHAQIAVCHSHDSSVTSTKFP
jgi:methylenetetrahydrofolate dehydrogenase (NADP+)/methenyltetrahydrofolate cyclohydrolase/formyltetrahydrofolate synthetase